MNLRTEEPQTASSCPLEDTTEAARSSTGSDWLLDVSMNVRSEMLKKRAYRYLSRSSFP